MGGDYIPSSFKPAPPKFWDGLRKVINDEDWYRFVGVRRHDANQLAVRDGDDLSKRTINDDLIEVFEYFDRAGDGAAIVFDRLLRKCWLAPWSDLGPFLEHSMSRDDEA